MPPVLRFAFRMMRRSPGFTAAAVLTLTLGIGANTAIFTVVNALVLRPLPLADPDHLVSISTSNAARGTQGGPFSVASYETQRDGNRSFSGVAAFCFDSLTLTGGMEPEQLAAARVSPNYFDVLGTRPVIGRGFRAAEGGSGAAPVALISHSLWQRRFQGDPAIVGKQLQLDNEIYSVIGVLPAEYAFPGPGLDVWVTRLTHYGVFTPEQIANGAGFLTGVARIAPGATIAGAQNQAAALYQQYRQEHPRAPDADPNGRMDLIPMQESLVSGIRPTLWILTGAVGLVLAIACANVAGLMAARSMSRAKEIAVRAALGASRGQLIAQLLLESLLLSVAGAALGALLAQWGVAWLVKVDAGNHLPRYQPISVDLVVLAFTAGVSLLTGAAFGLIPALEVSRPDLIGILRDGGRGSTGGRRHGFRSVLAAGQIALSVVLLLGAGLLFESFRRVQHVPLGFHPEHTLTARVTLPTAKYPEGPRRSQFVRELVGRLQQLPGVTAASVSLSVPFRGMVMSPVLAEGQPLVPPGQRPMAQWNAATPGYLQALGIPLLRGRDLAWADDERSTRVIVVTESLARSFWPNQDAIGKHLTFTRLQVPFEIIGIAADTRTRAVETEPLPMFYTSYAQWTWQALNVTIRAQGDAAQLGRALVAQVSAIDRDLPATDLKTMDDLVTSTLSQRRQTLYLIAAFAGLALVLALVGLYGVMAYSVAQRTTEFSIRQAVGAERRDILRMVLAQGMRLSLTGVGAGILAAVLCTKLIARMLFGVDAADPGIYAGIAALYLLVAAAASLYPAWRATRVDVMEALRQR